MKIYLESSLSSRRFALIIVADYSRELLVIRERCETRKPIVTIIVFIWLASTIELWIGAVQVTNAWEKEARSQITVKNKSRDFIWLINYKLVPCASS